MSQIDKLGSLKTAELFEQKATGTVAPTGANQFAEKLKAAMEDVNDLQVKGEESLSDLATGQVKDLHQAALAISKAETSMKLMLEVRNKALNAYKEITRTQM